MSSPKRPHPTIDPTAIGHVARIYGYVRDDQLRHALTLQQKRPGLKLGEALLECGFIAPADLQEVVSNQRRIRTSPKTSDIAAIVEYAKQRAQSASDQVRELCKALGGEDDDAG
jgi:hypothetical protein